MQDSNPRKVTDMRNLNIVGFTRGAFLQERGPDLILWNEEGSVSATGKPARTIAHWNKTAAYEAAPAVTTSGLHDALTVSRPSAPLDTDSPLSWLTRHVNLTGVQEWIKARGLGGAAGDKWLLLAEALGWGSAVAPPVDVPLSTEAPIVPVEVSNASPA